MAPVSTKLANSSKRKVQAAVPSQAQMRYSYRDQVFFEDGSLLQITQKPCALVHFGVSTSDLQTSTIDLSVKSRQRR